MPIVVIAVLAATAAVIVLIVAGPSRRIRREGQVRTPEYYSFMTGEPPPPTEAEAGQAEEGEGEAGESQAGPALGDEPIP